MAKSLTKSIRIPQRSFANVVPVTVPPLAAVLCDVKSAFFGLCVHAGKEVLSAMMEGDRVELCGPKRLSKRITPPIGSRLPAQSLDFRRQTVAPTDIDKIEHKLVCAGMVP